MELNKLYSENLKISNCCDSAYTSVTQSSTQAAKVKQDQRHSSIFLLLLHYTFYIYTHRNLVYKTSHHKECLCITEKSGFFFFKEESQRN
jgi:hypothetical protein